MKSLLSLLVLLFAVPCVAQERYRLESNRYLYPLTSRYSLNPPKIYSDSGAYLGELSQNKYAPDSVSNKYGRYGSKYSPDSINNKYGPYGRYRIQQIYVYPRW